MHALILDFVQAAPVPPVLTRLPMDDGALIAGFDPGSGVHGAPRWVAKTGYGPGGCRRLRAEAWALSQLDPWAESLGVPRLLGWHEDGAGPNEVACLVESGLAGEPVLDRWGGQSVPASLFAAVAWLRRFQALGIIHPWLGSSSASLAGLAESACAQAQLHIRQEPELAPLLEALLAPLQHGTPDRRAVAIHGDFWVGNVLLVRPGHIAVTDWSGFGPGSALDDILTWVANLKLGPPRSPRPRLACWQMVFFTAGPVRDLLRAWAEEMEYPAALARFAFHLFLLRRCLWELGFGLQGRTPPERDQARQEWSTLLAWMVQQEYPDPFQRR